MVDSLNQNFSLLLAGKYSKSSKQSTRRHQQANEGQCGLEAERIRLLGVSHSLPSEKKHSVVKCWETLISNNEEMEIWIKDYVERETSVARQRVQNGETAIMQQPVDMRNAEKARSTTSKPETTFVEMFNGIGESMSDHSSSDDEVDGEDHEVDGEDSAQGKQTKDDEPGWVMGTISKTVLHCMERFRPKLMQCDDLTQLGWGDAADYYWKRVMLYRTAKLMVPPVVKPQTDTIAARPSPTTSGELMQNIDIVPRH